MVSRSHDLDERRPRPRPNLVAVGPRAPSPSSSSWGVGRQSDAQARPRTKFKNPPSARPPRPPAVSDVLCDHSGRRDVRCRIRGARERPSLHCEKLSSSRLSPPLVPLLPSHPLAFPSHRQSHKARALPQRIILYLATVCGTAKATTVTKKHERKNTNSKKSRFVRDAGPPRPVDSRFGAGSPFRWSKRDPAGRAATACARPALAGERCDERLF